MAAMHDDVLEAMKENLTTYRDRMVGLLLFDMTHDECIKLVAPREHVPVLCNAAQFADLTSSEDWMTLAVPAIVDGEAHASVKLQMRTHAQKEPPLRPRAPLWQHGIEGQDCYVAGEKVIKWLEQRLVLGRRFGLASSVLHELSRICDTGAQVRYLWPAVMHLAKNADYTSRTGKWAEKNAVYKPQRHSPKIEPWLKSAIQDSSALLTSCMLIGDEFQPAFRGEVLVDCWSMPVFSHGEKTTARL